MTAEGTVLVVNTDAAASSQNERYVIEPEGDCFAIRDTCADYMKEDQGVYKWPFRGIKTREEAEGIRSRLARSQPPPSDEATSIHWALKRWREAEDQWISAMLNLAAELYEARQRFPSNKEFGVWLDRNSVRLNKDDRSALVNFGEHNVTAEDVLRTGLRSPQHIWRVLFPSSSAEEDVAKMPEFVAPSENTSPVLKVTEYACSGCGFRWAGTSVCPRCERNNAKHKKGWAHQVWGRLSDWLYQKQDEAALGAAVDAMDDRMKADLRKGVANARKLLAMVERALDGKRAQMAEKQARYVLSKPLVFGDLKQIEARKTLERLAEQREIVSVR